MANQVMVIVPSTSREAINTRRTRLGTTPLVSGCDRFPVRAIDAMAAAIFRSTAETVMGPDPTQGSALLAVELVTSSCLPANSFLADVAVPPGDSPQNVVSAVGQDVFSRSARSVAAPAHFLKPTTTDDGNDGRFLSEKTSRLGCTTVFQADSFVCGVRLPLGSVTQTSEVAIHF